MQPANTTRRRRQHTHRLAVVLAAAALFGLAITSAPAESPLSLGRPNPEGTSI
jgi:hypothetical protein